MKKVMCMGTFDILHPGHLDYFRQAKKHGDYLVVVVARDANVLKDKGRLSRRTEQERYQNVAVQAIVDKAVLGNEGDKLKIVEQEKPDIICLGYDQAVDETKLQEILKQRGLTPLIVRAKPYFPEKYKSSLLSHANQ